MEKKIGVVIALDGEREFTQAARNAQKEANMFKAELKKLTAEFDGNANSIDFLRKKQENLTKQQNSYINKVEAARSGLEKENTNYGAQPIGYILRRKGTEKPDQKLHIVREGMYIKKANADRRCTEINNAGIDCIVKQVGDMWWTQCGAFKELENAEVRVRQLRARGFDGMIK